MAEEGKKISFGFAKSIKKSVLKSTVPQEEKKVDYIECLDEKAIKVIGEEKKKDEPLVIPLLGSKTWHDRIINKIDADIFEPKIKEEKDKPNIKVKEEPNQSVEVSDGNASPQIRSSPLVEIKTEPPDNEYVVNTLDEQAAKEIIEDLKSTGNKQKEANNLTLPLSENETLLGREESTIEDYEKIPVDAFGLAMLRGMGWQPGKGIGKNEKVVAAAIPELRPKGMGLGADKVTIQKANSNVKNKQEEDLKIEKGTYVKIVAGKQSNNYGQIEGFDDDAGRFIVKMALGGNIISVNEFMVQPVTKSEYSKNSKVLNVAKYEKYKNKKERTSSESSVSDSERKDRVDKERKKHVLEKERSKLAKTEEKKRSTTRDKRSSGSDHESERKARKRRSSSSSDTYKPKKSKKSKKHKKQDGSPQRLSKKHKKKDKEREIVKDKKSRRSASLDRRKHKKHKRSRSRSHSRR